MIEINEPGFQYAGVCLIVFFLVSALHAISPPLSFSPPSSPIPSSLPFLRLFTSGAWRLQCPQSSVPDLFRILSASFGPETEVAANTVIAAENRKMALDVGGGKIKHENLQKGNRWRRLRSGPSFGVFLERSLLRRRWSSRGKKKKERM